MTTATLYVSLSAVHASRPRFAMNARDPGGHNVTALDAEARRREAIAGNALGSVQTLAAAVQP